MTLILTTISESGGESERVLLAADENLVPDFIIIYELVRSQMVLLGTDVSQWIQNVNFLALGDKLN